MIYKYFLTSISTTDLEGENMSQVLLPFKPKQAQILTPAQEEEEGGTIFDVMFSMMLLMVMIMPLMIMPMFMIMPMVSMMKTLTKAFTA